MLSGVIDATQQFLTLPRFHRTHDIERKHYNVRASTVQELLLLLLKILYSVI